MNVETAARLLAEQDQTHLLKFWDQLSASERTALLDQIADLDFTAIAGMRALLSTKKDALATPPAAMSPAPVSTLDGEARDAAERVGAFEIRNGRVAALVVAGGQGSRLGYAGPKGCYPVGPITQAPLFHFHVRKLVGLGREWGSVIPLYIMTSQANDAETRACFEANDYFGMNPRDVFFFTQSMWPALDAGGRVMLDAPGHIFMSPDGHGGTLSALARSGGLADMVARDITSVFYFQVDNPLVEVADPVFIGFHKQNLSEFSVKVCAKRSPEEGLGVVVERNGKTEVVEYTEFTTEQKNERSPDGELTYKYGSVAIHLFSTDFLVREAKAGLPLHIAHKKVPFCDDAGNTVTPDAPNAFKFEKFIFDALTDARVSTCLAFDRSEEFAPVKNAEGDDSPATCQAALQAKWARWLRAGKINVPCDKSGAPRVRIEIDPAFAHSANALRKKIKAEKRKIDPRQDILLQEPSPASQRC